MTTSAGRKQENRAKGHGEFYVAAQDQKGHSGRVDFRCIPAMKRNIKLALEKFQADTGWATDSDLCRWAIHYALDALATKFEDKEISNYQRQVTTLNALLGAEEDYFIFHETIKRTDVLVTEMIQSGLRESVEKLLLTVQAAILEMEDDAWRDTWEAEFNKRFKTLLPRALSLLPEHQISEAAEKRMIVREALKKKQKKRK